MKDTILINVTPQETRVACIEQGAFQEFYLERKNMRSQVGNIYLGKIVRVLPGMQAAFVNIGFEKTAFLHFSDIFHPEKQQTQAIEHHLFEGQSIMVQVVKDQIGTKGARLTTKISIAGRYLVYLPKDPYIGVSQKIAQETQRLQLKERLTHLLAKDEQGGYILRTLAEIADDQALFNDIQYLKKTWLHLTLSAQKSAAPSQLYQERSLEQRVLRDLVQETTQTIQIDSKPAFETLFVFAQEYMPTISNKLKYYDEQHALFERYHVEQELKNSLAQRVNLKSGGYILIEQTEALTTIDVNTGAYIGLHHFDETVFKTNLEATHTIARQLRLRNIGGIIVIDFIDMAHEQHQQAILEALQQAVAQDRSRIKIGAFSALGLVEMTRKRTSESLSQMLCEPCPSCQGKGHVKTAKTICYEILREILREAKQFHPKEFCIVASAAVIDLFLDEEAAYLSELGNIIGKPISLKTEAHLSQEQYDIILL